MRKYRSVHALALENLLYLRTEGQVKKWQSAVSLDSMKRTFGNFKQPLLPMELDLGIPPLELQQA